MLLELVGHQTISPSIHKAQKQKTKTAQLKGFMFGLTSTQGGIYIFGLDW